MNDSTLTPGKTESGYTETASCLRAALERQLQKLVRSVAVLGYCRHSGAVDAVGETIQEVEMALHQFQQQDQQQYQQQAEVEERTVIETHLLLDQARKLIGAKAMPRFAGENVVEMRGNYSDLADAEFERMLAASDVPMLYASTAATERRCFGPDQANDEGKQRSHLSLVVDQKTPPGEDA